MSATFPRDTVDASPEYCACVNDLEREIVDALVCWVKPQLSLDPLGVFKEDQDTKNNEFGSREQGITMRALLSTLSAILITIVSLSVIQSHVTQLFGGSIDFALEERVGDSIYHISLKNGLQFQISSAGEEQKKHSDGISALSINTDRAEKTDPQADPQVYVPPDQLMRKELSQGLSQGESLLETFERSRDRIFEVLLVNFGIHIERQLSEKTAWLDELHRDLRYLSLLALILLLLPFITYTRSKSVSLAMKLIPYSTASCACLMVISVWLLEQIYNLQGLQMTLGILSVPYNTLHLDGLLAIKLAPTQLLADHAPLLILEGFQWESTAGYTDPWGTLALLMSQLQASSIAHFVRDLIGVSEKITALYGPLFAGVSFYLIYVVIKPVMIELLKYPRVLVESDSTPSLRRFFSYLKLVFGVVWVEIRALFMTIIFTLALFTLMYALLLSASAIAGASLFSVAIWAGELASLSAELPEYSLAGVLSVIYLFLFLFNASMALILSLGIRSLYLVSRDKFTQKTSYRDYPTLSGVMRFTFKRALPKFTLQLITILCASLLVIYAQSAPTTSITLMICAFTIPVGALWFARPPIRELLTLYRADLLIRLPS